MQTDEDPKQLITVDASQTNSAMQVLHQYVKIIGLEPVLFQCILGMVSMRGVHGGRGWPNQDCRMKERRLTCVMCPEVEPTNNKFC